MKPHYFNEEFMQWRLKDSETISYGNEHFFKFFQIDNKAKLGDIHQLFLRLLSHSLSMISINRNHPKKTH